MKLIYVSMSFLIIIVALTYMVKSNDLAQFSNYPWIFWILTVSALIYQRIQTNGQKTRIRGIVALTLILLGFISYYTERSFIGQELLGYWLLLSSVALMSMQKLERNPFTSSVKRQILTNQKNRCAICRSQLEKYGTDFDHINGNNTNNKIRNCQALCTPCHRKKHASSL
jgi:hypothetical protein